VTPVHRLSGRDFDELAQGYGSADAVASLRSGQISRRLLLLRDWLDRTAPDSAFDLLQQADRADPTAVRAVVARPHFGAWVSRARRADRDEATAALSYFGSLAAVAAMRANVDFEIEVEVGRNGLYLPGLGRVGVPPGYTTINSKAGECRVVATTTVDRAQLGIKVPAFMVRRAVRIEIDALLRRA